VETVWLLMNQTVAAGNSGVAAGDSGGPVFWRAPDGELIVVGITSQADAQRVAVSWASRTDLAEPLDFIRFMVDLVDCGWLCGGLDGRAEGHLLRPGPRSSLGRGAWRSSSRNEAGGDYPSGVG
jgi:hypothetical protein